MAAHDDLTVHHPVVSHEEWLDARRALLEQEKAFTRQCDEMSRLQRSLPWERVVKEYTFDGPDGRETLADLFAGRSQLVVYHFMTRAARRSPSTGGTSTAAHSAVPSCRTASTSSVRSSARRSRRR